ncbi:MAG: hypothetical protein R3B51_04580 [Thermodesulfobacteriota bacterium]
MPYTTAMTIKGGTVATDFTSPIKLFGVHGPGGLHSGDVASFRK